MATFKERIKELRLSLNFSIRELSSVTGISKSALSAYECGKREASFESLKHLLMFLIATSTIFLGVLMLRTHYHISWENMILYMMPIKTELILTIFSPRTNSSY